MNTTATGGHRIDIDLHDFTTRIEAGQQLVAVAVGRLVAKLGGDDGAIDRQIVDVAGGKIPATAETVVPPVERWWQHMQLQLVAVGIGGLLENGQIGRAHV